MERNDMEVAAAKVTYLRGLLAVPCGILFIVIGLGNSAFDLPVSAFAVFAGLAMLVWSSIGVGLRPYHVAIWGALAVTGLLPVWGSLADKVSVAFLPIGVATIAAGLLDHRTLIQMFGPAADPDLATDSARA